MSSVPSRPPLDARDAHAIVHEALFRRWGYVPEWFGTAVGDDPAALPKSADSAMLWILARYIETLLQRLDQAPEKAGLAFLATTGIEQIMAQSAAVPVVFRTSTDGADGHLPAGTRLMAPAPPESTDQVVFETDRATGLAAGRMREVFSLWPGRDQYIDHSESATQQESFHPFRLADLVDTPHHVYIAHDRLLALDGKSTVEVEFELVRTSSEDLDIAWEYWDGEVWRGFRAAHPLCGEDERLDGTAGLTRSGVVRLESDCAETKATVVNGIESFWIRGRLRERMLPESPHRLPEVTGVRLSTVIDRAITCATEDLALLADEAGIAIEAEDASAEGIIADPALVDGAPVDASESFHPFGEQPGPGSVFYFAADEAFGRPGAHVTICVNPARTVQDDVAVKTFEEGSPSNGTPVQHTISWEYWDGARWRAFFTYENNPASNTSPLDFTEAGPIELTVPAGIRKADVDGQEAYWVRVRLVSGGFGFTQTVTWVDANNDTNEFTYVIPRPPALSEFRVGYTWRDGPYEPDHVVTYNDFAYEDATDAARWEGGTFVPYRPVRDLTPALYLGFDKRLPVDRLNLFFDLEEQSGTRTRPALVWEYWDGGAWARLTVEDGTRRLAVAGMVSFLGPGDSQLLARFGQSLHWVRARLAEDGPPGSPHVRQLFHNAVWAVQRETIVNEPIGASDGRPDQTFGFPRIPVLTGEHVEVREFDGARANVEWRIVATELFGGDLRRVRRLEERLTEEGPAIDIEDPPLRLRRDRDRRVVEVWVRWESRRHLLESGPADRHYRIERARGRIKFGDGTRGRIPPDGAAILARRYQTGGGRRGNVAARTITQAAAGIGGVESIFNPLAAEGGAEAETIARVAVRGPHTLHHRSRAVGPVDFETMAKEASAAVAVARALPLRDPAGRERPGWITLLIIPESQAPRPWPSWQLRQQIRDYIARHAGGDLVAAGRIHVTGPEYAPVDVDAEVIPLEGADAGAVETAARAAVETFLHPLRGGPDGTGWTMGRDVWLSDLAAVLERAPGVDHVRDLALLRERIPQGERLRVAANHVVAAGVVRILLRS